jgi:hypothetical protein
MTLGLLGTCVVCKQGAVMNSSRIHNAGWSKNARRVGLGFLAAALVLGWAFGGPALAAKKKSVIAGPDAYTIKLKEDPDIPVGKVAYLEGQADSEGFYLELKDLWITQPVEITLMAKSAEEDLRIELRKYHWKKPSQQGTTKGKGYCTFYFKTQGDVNIKILSPQGMRPFRLEVWVGPDMKPDLKPVIVHKKKN